ncbi:MAG: hypothetical protein OK442_01245 [Thaumarchaeota archaeon]|nr:hypothetical protein [Nitrososphaerota archaeon]
MVDSTDLVIIASVVQTVVISLTLLVFIFQFRSQERATKESAVANVMGRYTDYIGMLVERPELAKLLDFDSAMRPPEEEGPPPTLSEEERTLTAYLLLGYGLFEEIFSLHKKKWMDDETWTQWATFLERMTKQPAFRRIHRGTRGTFDKEFQDYVSKLMGEES